MMKYLIALGAILFATAAEAITYTTPSYTLTTDASTSVTCSPTAAASGPASAVVVGTVMFNCTVLPATWLGNVSPPTNVPLAVGTISAGAFTLTASAPGVVQTYPVGAGGSTFP